MGRALDSSGNASNGLLIGPFQSRGKSLRSFQSSAAPGKQLRASLMPQLYRETALSGTSIRRNLRALRRCRVHQSSVAGVAVACAKRWWRQPSGRVSCRPSSRPPLKSRSTPRPMQFQARYPLNASFIYGRSVVEFPELTDCNTHRYSLARRRVERNVRVRSNSMHCIGLLPVRCLPRVVSQTPSGCMGTMREASQATKHSF